MIIDINGFNFIIVFIDIPKVYSVIYKHGNIRGTVSTKSTLNGTNFMN